MIERPEAKQSLWQGLSASQRSAIIFAPVLVLIGVVMILQGGGGSAPTVTSEDDEQLAKAMCSDLSDGFSMFQMHSQAVEHYRGRGRSGDAAQLAAAKLEDLATREYCPQFRDDFEATFTYEEWIAP